MDEEVEQSSPLTVSKVDAYSCIHVCVANFHCKNAVVYFTHTHTHACEYQSTLELASLHALSS